jgi:type I restriction enzyme S subunit
MQRLRVFPMLIPPLAEQRRIVAKVGELMTLCDRLESALVRRDELREKILAATIHEALPAS